MRLMKCVLAFLTVFAILTATIVCSAVDFEIDSSDKNESQIADLSAQAPELKEQSAAKYTARLTPPSKQNKYYYSDKNVFYKYGWGMPNCTCYAWGRAYEILKSEPKLCIYSAYLWYDYNKENGFYAYGQTPKLGAIACWVYKSGTAGHVAVVEKITKDTITYSNSAWGGREFYTDTSPIDNPAGDESSWVFQGFIYIGEYQSNNTDKPEADVAGDVYRIISNNGVNLRLGPSTSYKTVGAISCGESVTVTKTQFDGTYKWGYTTLNGVSGWFVTDFADLIYTKPDKTPQKPDDEDSKDNTVIPAEPERQDIIGDTDMDGTISIIDATVMQLILADIKTPTQYLLALSDFDGDSKFSIIDATKLRRALAELE